MASEYQRWLQNLEAGDEVVVSGTALTRFSIVDRTTRTQIVVGNAKYRRSDGNEIGTDGWHYSTLEIPTAELKAELAELKERNHCYRIILDTSLGNLSVEQLRQIVAIIESAKPEA